VLTRRIFALAIPLALAACDGRSGKPRATASAKPAPSASDSASAPAPPVSAAAIAAPTTSAPAASSSDTDAAAPPQPALPPGDACRVARGPIQLSFTGPVLLLPGGPDGEPRVVFNRDGAPHAVKLPLPPKPAQGARGDAGKPPERLALAEPADRALTPACAAAGAHVFCIDRGGAIHRSAPNGDGATVVAQARPASPLAAATLKGGHVVYAFLGDRKTTEGPTTIAFAGLDDATPVQLSEDGSGATFVTLATRGDDAVAMYIDARRVLTPVHARVLSLADKLALGPDAVVFVGSGTDGRTPGALARGPNGHELALLPMDKDEKSFGMAAIRIEEKPRDDAATSWSVYPAAMERAAIACTQGTTPIHVVRTRPADAQPKAKTVLELGEVDAGGAFKTLCTIAESKGIVDPAILADPAGVWLAYTDGDGTWLERRGR
jgi:hypothetical protein